MPLIDVIYPEGALAPEAQARLRDELWSLALRWEGSENNALSASIAWVYLDERPTRRIGVGGREISQSVYRLNVRVMSGFMDQDRIDGLIAELTETVLEIDGSQGDGSSPRVFCIVEEIPSGTWGIDGRTWHSTFAAQTLGLDPSRILAMREGIASRPRLDVPLIPSEAVGGSQLIDE